MFDVRHRHFLDNKRGFDRSDLYSRTCRSKSFHLGQSLYIHAISNIYIFIAIALDESIFFDVLHFPMKNIMSRDIENTPMGEATSKPIQ